MGRSPPRMVSNTSPRIGPLSELGEYSFRGLLVVALADSLSGTWDVPNEGTRLINKVGKTSLGFFSIIIHSLLFSGRTRRTRPFDILFSLWAWRSVQPTDRRNQVCMTGCDNRRYCGGGPKVARPGVRVVGDWVGVLPFPPPAATATPAAAAPPTIARMVISLAEIPPAAAAAPTTLLWVTALLVV